MFETYNMKEFGLYMRKLRQYLNMTQNNVAHLAGLSIDTLRRIERGEVVPRFDTLIILSEVYRIDLIDAIKRHSASGVFSTYYSRLDKLIISFDEEELKNLREDFFRFSDRKKIDPPIAYNSQKQFLLILDGISEFYNKHLDRSRELFVEALLITNPLFIIENYHHFNYTMVEKRILMMIALSFYRDEDYEMAKDILEHILENMVITMNSSFNNKLLNIKVIANISYLYHNMSRDQEARDYAIKGIEFCLINHISYGLANLLARKGVAEYYMGNPDYQQTLQQSISLLRIEKQDELAQYYVEIMQEKYGINLTT